MPVFRAKRRSLADGAGYSLEIDGMIRALRNLKAYAPADAGEHEPD